MTLRCSTKDLRLSFEAACSSAVYLPKPWCWGLGAPDVLSLTGELLKAHGVPSAQVQLRAKLVLQALGKPEVSQALNGISPLEVSQSLGKHADTTASNGAFLMNSCSITKASPPVSRSPKLPAASQCPPNLRIWIHQNC